MSNLIVLTADADAEFLLKGLFPRIPAIEKINSFTFKINRHPYRDPGVYTDAHEFLRPFCNQYDYALVLLDHEGCGHENRSRKEIEQEIENNLSINGWGGRAAAIVVSVEIENWVWVNQVRLHKAVSWERPENVYDWLHNNGWKEPVNPKPARPKEAFEAILKMSKTPRSSSIYEEIASTASYKSCKDPAFVKMLNKLHEWFATEKV